MNNTQTRKKMNLTTIETNIENLNYGDDFRIFRCGKCYQLFDFYSENLNDAYDCCVCDKYIGLTCTHCVDAYGEKVYCDHNTYVNIRCNKSECQNCVVKPFNCSRCNHREKSFD